MIDPAYPRPDRCRRRWLSLDGRWGFAFDPDDSGIRKGWHLKNELSLKITVPFCVESEAGGIALEKHPPVFWYGRSFSSKDLPEGSRFFLNFGAVDYEARVWLNGIELGSHRGGYTPFSFEITGLIDEENRLALRVADHPRRDALRGKQRLCKKLSDIFYTPVSGIWQPVYIYACGPGRIQGLRIGGDDRSITVDCIPEAEPGSTLSVEILDPQMRRVAGETLPAGTGSVSRFFRIAEPLTWSPQSPALYTVLVRLHGPGGELSDEVISTAGLRAIEARGGSIYCNGVPLYLKMLLVQGYFPGGIYTPEKSVLHEEDVTLFREMGFNCIRMHQKIEDPRFLHFCDRHGLLVWEEMPSPFLFGRLDEAQYAEELFEVLERDAGRPSVMAMVLFNETWGIYDLLWAKRRRRYLKRLYRRVREASPGLLVVDNSGFDHIITDIVDIHHYLASEKKIRKFYGRISSKKKIVMRFFKIIRSLLYLLLTHRVTKRPYLRGGEHRGHEPFVVSECGGAGYYKSDMTTLESLAFNVKVLRDYPFIRGYCFTQAYDVENEKNGLLDQKRRPKYPLEKIRAINDSAGG